MTVEQLIDELKKLDKNKTIKVNVHKSYALSEVTRDSYVAQNDVEGVYDLENGIITLEAGIWISED
jgi:hypothetical protein